jgi:hypothetical protein
MTTYIATANYQGEPDAPYIYEAPAKRASKYKFHIDSVSQTDSGKFSVTFAWPHPDCPQTYKTDGTPYKRTMCYKTVEMPKPQYEHCRDAMLSGQA